MAQNNSKKIPPLNYNPAEPSTQASPILFSFYMGASARRVYINQGTGEAFKQPGKERNKKGKYNKMGARVHSQYPDFILQL